MLKTRQGGFAATLLLCIQFGCARGEPPWDSVLWMPRSTFGGIANCEEAGEAGSRAVVVVPGDYDLQLVATAGDMAGSESPGMLTLLSASSRDRSPRTGEQAADFPSTPVLYGAAIADWTAVDAAIETEIPGVPPNSLDPVYPGVVVRDRKQTGLEILVGTVASIRTGVLLDGAGIVLEIANDESGLIRGYWRSYGLKTGGSGYFCMRPVS